VVLFVVIVCFFFQAEDGIRDDLVTGVQTCALPIYVADRAVPARTARSATSKLKAFYFLPLLRLSGNTVSPLSSGAIFASSSSIRSEERRVGKECRSREVTYH